MITISVHDTTGLVWSASDWLKLREEHRIVGNLTGCLVGLPRQETFQGLPLALHPEEVTLLVEKKLAILVDDSCLSRGPKEEDRDEYDLYKEENKKEQIACYETQRRQRLTLMIDRIIEGKRRKLMGLNTKNKKGKTEETNAVEAHLPQVELNREEILKEELERSSETFSPPLLVHTFTREHFAKKRKHVEIIWNFPVRAKEKLRYLVFKDLWGKGHYITQGHKFGVDYLVYPGDPVKFHAHFLVVCVGYKKFISTRDFIAYGRLASTARKTLVIASRLPNKTDVVYQSFQWADNN